MHAIFLPRSRRAIAVPGCAGVSRMQTAGRWLVAAVAVVCLCACSPTFDWREVHGQTPPYVALMPAKPVAMSREINLDGRRLTMLMTAARVEGVSFAVGSASLSDAAAAPAALSAMKNAMLRNIQGRILKEKSQAASPGTLAAIEIDASGVGAAGQRVHLAGRFVVHGLWIYQAVVIGDEKNWPAEATETFLSSFRAG